MQSLASLYCSYVKDHQETKVRDPLRLFITDIGKCPRQVAYRLLGEETNIHNTEYYENQQIMWDLAEYMEATLAQALETAGMLIDYQGRIGDEQIGRKNWGGRFDFLADYRGRRVIEGKTLRSNAFGKELDYPNHRYQASVYHKYLKETFNLETVPLLIYFDRGGSNTPIEQPIFSNVQYADIAEKLMDELDMVRDTIPDLPPQREKELKVLDRGKTLKLVCHRDCTYCDYSDKCQPDKSTQTWAKREDPKGAWVYTKKADMEKCLAFADAAVEEAMSDE